MKNDIKISDEEIKKLLKKEIKEYDNEDDTEIINETTEFNIVDLCPIIVGILIITSTVFMREMMYIIAVFILIIAAPLSFWHGVSEKTLMKGQIYFNTVIMIFITVLMYMCLSEIYKINYTTNKFSIKEKHITELLKRKDVKNDEAKYNSDKVYQIRGSEDEIKEFCQGLKLTHTQCNNITYTGDSNVENIEIKSNNKNFNSPKILNNLSPLITIILGFIIIKIIISILRPQY